MKAVSWYGSQEVRVENVPDPKILNPRDAIVKVTTAAICGSDLHLYHGNVPTMKRGDILGHEFMGEVVEVGKGNRKLRVGDRVVVPFSISCGNCFYCRMEAFTLCDNSNPNFLMQEKVTDYPTAGLFGYTHLYGGYPGGQAEYVRVPFADVGPIRIPDDMTDEQVLFLGDIFPTAYHAAINGRIQPGDVVAVWGCGPVGLLTIKCAYLLGAERVIAIDHVSERLEKAKSQNHTEVLNFEEVDVVDALKDITAGRGPDVCIDAVGMDADEKGPVAAYEKLKQKFYLETDRPFALREAIRACRNGGTVSLPGVYAGYVDKMPMGIAFGKGITFRMGQTPVQKYTGLLLDRIIKEKIDLTYIVTHRMSLDEAPDGYRIFNEKEDGCIKVILKP
ncbi:MAG: glutathione-dependent formaldehyde dehydrogenase [Candidatus Manganitrophus sp. SA1]|nr:glutathione-dependent formaldehyde dehydrogenase [Candidatus Manganitrophus morganii]